MSRLEIVEGPEKQSEVQRLLGVWMSLYDAANPVICDLSYTNQRMRLPILQLRLENYLSPTIKDARVISNITNECAEAYRDLKLNVFSDGVHVGHSSPIRTIGTTPAMQLLLATRDSFSQGIERLERSNLDAAERNSVFKEVTDLIRNTASEIRLVYHDKP